MRIHCATTTKKMLVVRRGYLPPVVRYERFWLKVGEMIFNRPGAFLYPSPEGLLLNPVFFQIESVFTVPAFGQR